MKSGKRLIVLFISLIIICLFVISCDSLTVESTSTNTVNEVTDITDTTSSDNLNNNETETESKIESESKTETESEMVNEVIYPHDEVLEVNIEISADNYQSLKINAMDEVYYTCNITYNGYTLSNVAIRTKGNSSLRDVYTSGSDRFSYNIDLNYFEDQDLFGIDKIILNNLFMDPSMIAEYLTYEALDSLGTVSSRTTFVALSINDEYYGLYLSVEQVGNEFLDTTFGNSDGEQYKPDSGFGSSLNYISDTTIYSGLVNKNTDDLSNEAIIELLEKIDSGEDLTGIFNVDSYLKYLAVSTYTVNLDSYQGGMYHNYYLYNNNGVFEWIAWDLNMSFNGFPGVQLSDSEAVLFLIDEPVVNSMSNYPLIEAVLSNETYLELYHTYLNELLDGYFDYDTFQERVVEISDMINEYVENDSNSFYSYSTYQKALFTSTTFSYSILEFVEKRNANIEAQLSGEIASTNNGLGNVVDNQKPNQPRR